MGIRPLFSVILISEEVGIKKPDPRIFLMALEKLGMLASEVIFVGDNPRLDVTAPATVGIRAIWLNCRGQEPPTDVECAERITALDEMLGICRD